MKSICVFCAASDGVNTAYAGAAEDLGRQIAGRGLRLVYGGGSVGLMGIVARAAKRAGGEVIGVIPSFLRYVEAPEGDISEMHIVQSMHERKQMMFDFSDGFIVLPGGIGTLDETIEIMTWAQLERHTKPIMLVNTLNYWSAFDAMMDHIITNGFARPGLKDLYRLAPTPEAALTALMRA
jgi:uncharacterized protein (TIGR00730 family)